MATDYWHCLCLLLDTATASLLAHSMRFLVHGSTHHSLHTHYALLIPAAYYILHTICNLVLTMYHLLCTTCYLLLTTCDTVRATCWVYTLLHIACYLLLARQCSHTASTPNVAREGVAFALSGRNLASAQYHFRCHVARSADEGSTLQRTE